MNTNYNYKQFKLLYVDDELQTISNFQEYFSDVFDVMVAPSAEEGWKLFQAEPDAFAIVMTDQRMPGASGVQLLEKVKASRPRVLRILATAYSDMDAAISAVNTGAIYKYVTKPWDIPTLEINLKRGMEFYLVQRERDLLMREKMSALQRLMMTDRLISLGIFAAGLNHHLRNSLTAVKTFLDLAPFKLQSENIDVTNLRSPDYWNDFYQTVQSQMSKILGLLQDVQQIPEPPRHPMSDEVDVAVILRECLQSKAELLKSRNISLKEHTPSEKLKIQGNAAMLRQAFSLLLEDESTYVNQGGQMEVKVTTSTCAHGRPGVLVQISDNGPGLTPETLGCIFDPFFTRKQKPDQYGLNLLASFFLVYHHAGTISVSSSPSGGALFEIFLPEDPTSPPSLADEEDFLRRVLAAEKNWEKMLIGD
jgi:two-component system, probable response regulator PhcQ